MGWKDIPEKTVEKFGLQSMVENAKIGNCPFCAKEVKMADFRDPLSIKEFRISGLCQACQDDFFGNDPNLA